MQEFKFDYDKENDDLFLYNPRTKSTASIEVGKLVLDFNRQKKLTAIEIMDATDFLKPLAGKLKINKVALSNIVSCKIQTKAQDNFLLIKMLFLMRINRKEIELPLNMPIPRVSERSPALLQASHA